jgi:hypothetical protein
MVLLLNYLPPACIGKTNEYVWSVTVSLVASGLETGSKGRFMQYVVRMRWWVGNSVTLRFCVTEEWP